MEAEIGPMDVKLIELAGTRAMRELLDARDETDKQIANLMDNVKEIANEAQTLRERLVLSNDRAIFHAIRAERAEHRAFVSHIAAAVFFMAALPTLWQVGCAIASWVR